MAPYTVRCPLGSKMVSEIPTEWRETVLSSCRGYIWVMVSSCSDREIQKEPMNGTGRVGRLFCWCFWGLNTRVIEPLAGSSDLGWDSSWKLRLRLGRASNYLVCDTHLPFLSCLLWSLPPHLFIGISTSQQTEDTNMEETLGTNIAIWFKGLGKGEGGNWNDTYGNFSLLTLLFPLWKG